MGWPLNRLGQTPVSWQRTVCWRRCGGARPPALMYRFKTFSQHQGGEMIYFGRRSKPSRAEHQHASRGTGHTGKAVPVLAVGVTLAVAATACSSGRRLTAYLGLGAAYLRAGVVGVGSGEHARGAQPASPDEPDPARLPGLRRRAQGHGGGQRRVPQGGGADVPRELRAVPVGGPAGVPAGLVHHPRARRARPDNRARVGAGRERLLSAVADGDRQVESQASHPRC